MKPPEIITYFFLSLCLFLSVCFPAVKGISLASTSVNDRKYVFYFRPKPKPEKHLGLDRIPKPKPKVQIYVKIGGIEVKYHDSNDLSN